MKSDCTSSHSRLPAKPGAKNPDDPMSLRKITENRQIGQPQMQQQGGGQETQQQGDEPPRVPRTGFGQAGRM